MATIHATESAIIAAPAAVVFGIIADYRDGHPRILPPEYFRSLTVERGGVGAGTVIRFEMVAFGKVNQARAEISEPEPGRRLVETVDAGPVTTFVVDPESGGQAARVTIDTIYQKGGIAGWVESLLAPGFLRKVYRAELAVLAQVATGTR